jgi:hypothetical protein
MYFDTSLKTSRRECSAISSPGPCHAMGIFLFLKNIDFRDPAANKLDFEKAQRKGGDERRKQRGQYGVCTN